MLVTAAKALENRLQAFDPHRRPTKYRGWKLRIGMPPRLVPIPVFFGPGVSLWNCILEEGDTEAHLTLARAIASREWAEVLAEKGDIKGACESYRETLKLKEEWEWLRIQRWVSTRAAFNMTPMPVDPIMDLNVGKFSEALEGFRGLWTTSGDCHFAAKREGTLIVVTFSPPPYMEKKGFPSRISDDVLAVLKDPPGDKKP